MTDTLLLKTDQDNFQSLNNLKSIVACVKYMLGNTFYHYWSI